MKIHIFDIDNGLIERYCKTIIQCENGFVAEIDEHRKKLHDEIFESVNLNRALVTRDERKFSMELSKTIVELCETYQEYE